MDLKLAHAMAALGILPGADNMTGFQAMPKADRRRYFESIQTVQRVLDACKRLSYGGHKLKEAFSTSDFPLAFGWYTDIKMLAAYQNVPNAWPSFLSRGELPDFRPAARDRLHGLNSPLQSVAQGTPYPNDATLGPGNRDTSLVVNKVGREFGINWEAMINDVLRQLDRIPSDLAEAAARTEMLTATQAYAANAAVYGNHTVGTATISNKGTGALTLVNLNIAITKMRKLRDEKGNPIFTGEKLTLVVPPDLEITAKIILGAQSLTFDTNPATGTQKQRMETANYLAPICNLVVDYYLPIVDPTNGTTGWYLFADPSVFPAGEVVFLSGHTSPELFMRAPNAIALSAAGGMGGPASPMDGSFENDDIRYKMRYAVGASIYEWRAPYYADGTTS